MSTYYLCYITTIMDINSIKARITKFHSLGYELFPHSFPVTKSFKEYIIKYKKMVLDGEVYNGTSGQQHHNISDDLAEAGFIVPKLYTKLPEKIETIAGRIIGKRGAGKMVFYTVREGEETLQIVMKLDNFKDKDYYKALNKVLGLGFYFGATGFVGKTKKGELSLFATDAKLLAPCENPVPKYVGISDPETRSRKRYLDLMTNPSSMNTFIIRSKVISLIRKFLENHNFLEVETPILSLQAGGAIAKPFHTHHNDLKQDMVMRISPELFLKELVIGGIERVFEIGKQFRNETIDSTHNPEFTTLEFYAAKHDYNDLMKMCEKMVSSIVYKITGSYIVKYQMNPLDESSIVEINFEPPFKRIDMMDELENKLGKLPLDWSSEEARVFFTNKCNENHIEVKAPATITRMIDKLVGKFIENDCTDPTFIINHPVVMSPLAKWHRDDSRKTERFELFCGKFEVANAYTELNDPAVQRERFEQQSIDREAGDEEVPAKDNDFIHALEYGLPPTGGFGMGIDRFVMLLTNSSNIFDVILFPSRSAKTNDTLTPTPTVTHTKKAIVPNKESNDFQIKNCFDAVGSC